jgi:hypothetical protein
VADEPREKRGSWLEPNPPELGTILTRGAKFLLMGAALLLVVHIGELPRWITILGGVAIMIWWLKERSTIPWGERRGRG